MSASLQSVGDALGDDIVSSYAERGSLSCVTASLGVDRRRVRRVLDRRGVCLRSSSEARAIARNVGPRIDADLVARIAI